MQSYSFDTLCDSFDALYFSLSHTHKLFLCSADQEIADDHKNMLEYHTQLWCVDGETSDVSHPLFASSTSEKASIQTTFTQNNYSFLNPFPRAWCVWQSIIDSKTIIQAQQLHH